MNIRASIINYAAAFLKRNNQYLLMKRSPARRILPNIWSSVGGHMEPHEANDPMTACLREIHEESGITREHVLNLTLRYIIIRQTATAISVNYIFFGETDASEVTDTDEGTLHWIDEDDLLNREFSKTYGAALRHYTETPDVQGRVVVGVAGGSDGHLRKSWSLLEDFE